MRLTDASTNIYCHAPDGQRQHVLNESCWCEPLIEVMEFDSVIWHDGQVRPSVAASIARERVGELFDRPGNQWSVPLKVLYGAKR